MLKQDTINKIASLLKLKPDELTNAIKDTNEVDVTIDDKISAFTEDEIKTLKSNSYNDGKKAGVEMNVDEVKKELGLEFQGKTIKGLVEAANKKALEDAKIPEAEKVKELSEKLTTLQKTVKEKETALAEKEKEVSSIKTTGELYKHIPELGDDAPALGKDDVIQLMRANGYDYKLEEGKIVFIKDGKPVTDNVLNPLPAKDVVANFMKEKKLITDVVVPGGRGAGDKKPPAGFGKLSELEAHYKAQGKSTQGEEFIAHATKLATENKDFKINE